MRPWLILGFLGIAACSALTCPDNQPAEEVSLLVDASHHSAKPSDLLSPINNGTFDGVKVVYRSGYIACSKLYNKAETNNFDTATCQEGAENVNTCAGAYGLTFGAAWQGCGPAYTGTNPSTRVNGGAFALKKNGGYVYEQTSWNGAATACTDPFNDIGDTDYSTSSNVDITCTGAFTLVQGDRLQIGWYESFVGGVSDNSGTIWINLIGLRCPPEATCSDNIQNQDETRIDCGGTNCDACPTCSDNIQNQGETGIDCGGPNCDACPTCSDNIQNQGETGVDCGGPNCLSCSAFECPNNQHAMVYPLLSGVSYDSATMSATITGPRELVPDNLGHFDAVEARYKSGFISCSSLYLPEGAPAGCPTGAACPEAENIDVSLPRAWQGCGPSFGNAYTVTGAAFELKKNGEYVFKQPNFNLPACKSEEWAEGSCNPACTSPFDENVVNQSKITCTGDLNLQVGDYLDVGWFETWQKPAWLGDNVGTIWIDLVGLRCANDVAVPVSCTDGLQNQNETDIDCGGICDACPDPLTCTDGILNQGEIEIDCGGSHCDACACDADEAAICHALADCSGTDVEPTFPDGVTVPADSDRKFECTCPSGILGHGYGASGCSTSGWNVRVVYMGRLAPLSAPEQANLLSLLGVSCTPGSTTGCDHVHYTIHGDHFPGHIGANVLFPATTAGKTAAEAAMAAFNLADTAVWPAGVSVDVGARVYAWTSGTTSNPLQVRPAGFELLSVRFQADCAETGCWVLDVDFTVGHSDAKIAGLVKGFNTFYLPYAIGSDTLSYDYTYGTSIMDSFEPANFPCRTHDYLGGDVTAAQTLCCLGTEYGTSTALGGAPDVGFLGNYRPTNAFQAYAEPLGSPQNAACMTTLPEDVEPDYFDGLGFFGIGQQFTDMDDSPGITSVTPVDSFVGMYKATIKLDEKELRTRAGLLKGTVGVEHTIDTFLGYANFKPATKSVVLDAMATQTNIHLEKTSFFSVSTHGTNVYTFLEYINLRLVTVYLQDTDFSDAGNGAATSDFIETNSTGSADYIQVTFTLGSQYGVNDGAVVNSDDELIPSSSVRAGKGTFFDDIDTPAGMVHKCLEYEGSSFPSEFDSRINDQDCSPSSTMCASPASIPDHFVSYNIPLGLDYFPPAAADLSQNIFVSMVINAVDLVARDAGGAKPNAGGDPWQMKTTLFASIPVVRGGINIFCDGLVAKTDLKDVANADIIVGSAASSAELSRLRIKKNVASTQLAEADEVVIDSDSIEAGLMTLVLNGNSSYFGLSGNLGVSIELEDVITIHVMQDDGIGQNADVITRAGGIEDLLDDSPDDNSFSDGLDTNGYALNGAFSFALDRGAQRAHLEPSPALLSICPFNPARPVGVELETCVTRRDVRYRGYPARTGSVSTAMEICSNVQANAGLDCSTAYATGSAYASSACCTQDVASVESAFFTTIFGNNDYAKQLAVDFANVVATEYQLNGRFRRAYWINPGYEWTPTQTGGNSIFQVSQKLFMFALITLDEGIVNSNDDAINPGLTLPSVRRRRMLLQTADALKEAQASGASNVMTFQTTPTSMMAKAFKVPEDRVATFSVQMQLTEAQACLEPVQLQNALRETLDDYAQKAISEYHTLQVTTLAVNKGDVECSRRALSRKLLAFSTATADVTMLVVFQKGAASEINIARMAQAPGVQSITPLSVSANINTDVAVDQDISIKPPAPEASSSSNVVLIAGVCGGVGGLLVAAVGGMIYMRSRQPEPVSAVTQAWNVNDLKQQLAEEV